MFDISSTDSQSLDEKATAMLQSHHRSEPALTRILETNQENLGSNIRKENP